MKIKLTLLVILLAVFIPTTWAQTQGSQPMRSPKLSAVITASGTVPKGFREVVFIVSSDFVGTIAGGPVTGAEDKVIPWRATAGTDFLDAIPYVVTTGSLRYKTIK